MGKERGKSPKRDHAHDFGKKMKKKIVKIIFPRCSPDKLAIKTTEREQSSPQMSSREAIGAWHRPDVDVYEYYKVIDRIGQGHMGEISIVTRIPEKWNSPSRKRQQVEFERGIPIKNLSLSSRALMPPNSDDEFLRCYACKTVSTARMNTADMEEMLNEVSIMRQLDHPHILQLFEVYSTKRKMWLITELCYGGDLFTRNLSEASAVVVMEQILQALSYMHARGVCHRDLKLENILYETPEPNSGIKLIDFGLSQRFHAGVYMRQVCGTVYTVAPEIIETDLQTNKLGYTEKSDIFSVGCIAFIILSTDYPFLKSPNDVHDEAKLRRLLDVEYTFGPKWMARHISDESKGFIDGTLRKDATKRWSAVEALNYIEETWIPALEERLASQAPDTPTSDEANNDNTEADDSVRALDNAAAVKKRRRRVKMKSTAFHGMENYARYGLMKKTVLIALAKTMDKSMLSDLRDLFIAIDSDNTGTISMEDFKEACMTYFQGRDFANDENIEAVFHAIDTSRSGEVQYNEFLAALAESQGLITMERLQEAFDRLDTEGKGYISKGDLRSVMGTEANEKVLNEMMDEAGGKDGKIDYDKFLRLMFQHPTRGNRALASSFTNREALYE